MLILFFILMSTVLVLFGILSLRQNIKSATNQNFFFFIICIISWLFTNYISNSTSDYNVALWSNKLIFTETTLMLYFLIAFILAYPKEKFVIASKWKWLILTSTIFILLISLTDLIVNDVIIYPDRSDIDFNFGVILYFLFVLGSLILIVRQLILKYRSYKGVEKLKIQYLALGIVFSMVGLIITNLLLPLLFNVFIFTDIGLAFLLFFIGFTSYSIIRHRFLGVKVLVGNLIILSTVSLFTFVIFYLVLLIENSLFSSPLTGEAVSANIFIAFIFSGGFLVIYNAANKYISKTVIHSEYNPDISISNLDSNVSKRLNLGEVIKDTSIELRVALKVNKVFFLITKKDSNQIYDESGSFGELPELPLKKILDYIRINQVIIAEEIESQQYLYVYTDVLDWMKKNGISLIFPLGDDEISGLGFLGERSIPYDTNDIDFITRISRSATTAIGRAVYFQDYEKLISELEEKVKERTEQYVEIAQQQKDIIDVMGHEIRTPLAVIKQMINTHKIATLPFIQKWKDGKATPEEIDYLFNSVNLMDKSLDQALMIVKDMLETARLDKNRFELEYTKFNIVEVASTSVELLTKIIDPKVVTLKFNKPSEADIEVEADKVRITEALDALLNNALKYGKNPDTQTTDVDVNLTKDNDYVYISVKDHGRGIDPEDIPKLGKKFVRLQPKTQNFERPGGTGLGLFVIKGVMEFHKGDLIIESEGMGKGSTFILKFPIKKPAGAGKPAEEKATEEIHQTIANPTVKEHQSPSEEELTKIPTLQSVHQS